jgi:hypothetical protein
MVAKLCKNFRISFCFFSLCRDWELPPKQIEHIIFYSDGIFQLIRENRYNQRTFFVVGFSCIFTDIVTEFFNYEMRNYTAHDRNL